MDSLLHPFLTFGSLPILWKERGMSISCYHLFWSKIFWISKLYREMVYPISHRPCKGFIDITSDTILIFSFEKLFWSYNRKVHIKKLYYIIYSIILIVNTSSYRTRVRTHSTSSSIRTTSCSPLSRCRTVTVPAS